jgi:hypothetical protein
MRLHHFFSLANYYTETNAHNITLFNVCKDTRTHIKFIKIYFK